MVVGLKKKIELGTDITGRIMYFLNDYAEFGRKVKISKPLPTFITDTGEKYYDRGKNINSSIIPKSLKGDTFVYGMNDKQSFQYKLTNKKPKSKNSIYADKMPIIERVTGEEFYTSHLGNKKTTRSQSYTTTKNNRRQLKRDLNKAPIILDKNQSKTVLSKKKTSTKSIPKFINKYTLGTAGLLGAGAGVYGGYKLLTRNKNKKEK